MANAPNTTTNQFGSRLLHPGWDRSAAFILRTMPTFRQFVTKRVVDPTNRSNVYYMPIHGYFQVAENRHRVDEVVAPDLVESPPSYYVRLQVHEHGFPVGRTTFLDDTSYIPVDPVIAEQATAHRADTIDALIADQLYNGAQFRSNGHEAVDQGQDGGTQTVTDELVPFTQVVSPTVGGMVDWDYDPTTDRGSLVSGNTAASHNLTSRVTARVVAKLRDAAAPPWLGRYYFGLAHPDTVVDYQEDTGDIGWQDVLKRNNAEQIYAGTIGQYRGVSWVEHPRARKLAEAGDSDADVYQTLIFGKEILAEQVVREPAFGVGPILDEFNRHRKIHWYGTLGHCIYRQEPLWRVEHTIKSA